jgi:hypothetical protein
MNREELYDALVGLWVAYAERRAARSSRPLISCHAPPDEGQDHSDDVDPPGFLS